VRAIRRCTSLACLVAACALAGARRPPPPKGAAARAVKTRHIVTEHFHVQFTLPLAVGKGYAALCERAYGRFCDILKVPRGEAVWQGKCKVALLGTPQEFASTALALGGPAVAKSGGFARPSRREPLIVMPMYGQERVRLEQTLIHEMTHVFLQLFRKEVVLPTWLQEGCAQFFEFLHRPGDPRLKRWRAIVKSLVAGGKERPLRQFWVSGFPPTDAAAYAQAWSLVDYLSRNPRTKGKIGKFVLKLKELAPTRRGFAPMAPKRGLERVASQAAVESFQLQAKALELVTGVTAAELERGWKRFVLASY